MPKAIELQFHPAHEPPDAETTVLCSDGEEVYCGWYEGADPLTGKQTWYDTQAYICEVKAWAHLPDPQACI